MRICIGTVYNSLNAGSYLQAMALMSALNVNGNNVSFLETRSRNPLRILLLSSLKYIINGQIKALLFFWGKWSKFQKLLSSFPVSKVKDEQHVYVLGSDEIWNIGRKEFSRFPVFWGEGINAGKIVSYAPSINRATLQDFKDCKYPEECLAKFGGISVRDLHSKQVLQQLTNKKIEVVLDPTLLFESDFYQKHEHPIQGRNYILVYAYANHINRDQITRLRIFAQKKGLPLVAINNYTDWCDKSYPASPAEFLAFFRHASYVVTDTFHGTIFSVIYKKQFASYADNNIKILDFLDRMNLQTQNATKEIDINTVLGNSIDYDAIHGSLAKQRGQSLGYLYNAIKN